MAFVLWELWGFKQILFLHSSSCKPDSLLCYATIPVFSCGVCEQEDGIDIQRTLFSHTDTPAEITVVFWRTAVVHLGILACTVRLSILARSHLGALACFHCTGLRIMVLI